MFRLYWGEILQQWRPTNVNLRPREEEQIGSFPIKEYRYCTWSKVRETTALEEQILLCSGLYEWCKSRQANVVEFFRHKNHEYLSWLSDYGRICTPTSKVDFLKCLPQFIDDSKRQFTEIFGKYEVPKCWWLYHLSFSSSTNE